MPEDKTNNVNTNDKQISIPEIDTDSNQNNTNSSTSSSRSFSFSYTRPVTASQITSSNLASDVYFEMMEKQYNLSKQQETKVNNNYSQPKKETPKFDDLLTNSINNMAVDYNNPIRKYSTDIAPMEYDKLWNEKRKYLGTERAWSGGDVMNLIGDNQSIAQKWGHGIPRFLGSIVTKTLAGVGYLLDMAAYGVTDLIDAGVEAAGGDMGTYNFSDFLENGTGSIFEEIEAGLK